MLLQQVAEPVETAILVRTNYEVGRIEEILSGVDSPQEIEVTTIHKAKGRGVGKGYPYPQHIE